MSGPCITLFISNLESEHKYILFKDTVEPYVGVANTVHTNCYLMMQNDIFRLYATKYKLIKAN